LSYTVYLYILGRGKLNKLLIFLITIIILSFCVSLQLIAQEKDLTVSDGSRETFNLEEEPDTGAAEDGVNEEDGSNFLPIWEFLRMLLVLGCVVGVIYLFFFFLKKGMKKKLPENNLIKVITAAQLQGNNMLYLVQIGLEYFLIGSGSGGLSQIARITDKETIDSIMLNTAEESIPSKQSFSDILLKIFNPGKKHFGLSSNPINFMKKQQERLNNLK